MLIEGPCTQCGKDEPISCTHSDSDSLDVQRMCAVCLMDMLDALPETDDDEYR